MTAAEAGLVTSVFHDQVDPALVRIRRHRWFPWQPRDTVMAPCGDIHFHPQSPIYRDDFGEAPISLQGLLLHEMAHVWQVQQHHRWYLIIRRHPFCRYRYALRAGWTLSDYGVEQQAELIRHAFLIRQGEYAASASAQAAIIAIVDTALPGS